jgi:diadenosine tetraphosphatase ApaH/serine/threonine PP2A family protein phosphatase
MYLLKLPLTRRLVLDGKRYLLVHGTPRDPLDEYLMKEPELWSRRLHNVDADVVCVGHSHMQFNLRAGNSIVLNPGSVGMPRDGDARAAYAVIDDGRIELKRVEYPIAKAVDRIQAADLPERAKLMLSECLRNGRLNGTAEASSAPKTFEPDPAEGLDLD